MQTSIKNHNNLIDKLLLVFNKLRSPFIRSKETIRKINRHAWLCQENMPQQLRKAKLLMNEEFISNDLFNGKVDQVYQLKNNILIIVDTKTHAKVTLSDILQLSIYRYILKDTKHLISDFAYVRHAVNNQIFYTKVKLLDSFIIKGLIDSKINYL